MRWNFFDGLLGVKQPTIFKKEVKESIKEQTLVCLKNYGRERWIQSDEIAKFIVNSERTIVQHRRAVEFLYYNYGLRGEIGTATHKLREEGHPIIAGRGQKGYRYADEQCPDVDEAWEDRYRAWELSKDDILNQAILDLKLLNKILSKLEDYKKRKKLNEIKQKYEKFIKVRKREKPKEEKEENDN